MNSDTVTLKKEDLDQLVGAARYAREFFCLGDGENDVKMVKRLDAGLKAVGAE